MIVRCFILEDQAPARRVVEGYLSQLPGFELVGSAAAPSEALPLLKSVQVELLFLDLGLPQRDGFDFLQALEEPPIIVVTTAYSSRALEGFAHGVADFLVKPFPFERFKIATERAVMGLRARHDETIVTIPIERGLREFVPARSIVSLSADGDYVKIRTVDRYLHTQGPLAKWEAELAALPFVRIHRSHIVNSSFVSKLMVREVEVAGERLPVSATYRKCIEQSLEQMLNKP
jgi:DNA-binding LytR/AlgR family response regulator